MIDGGGGGGGGTTYCSILHSIYGRFICKVRVAVDSWNRSDVKAQLELRSTQFDGLREISSDDPRFKIRHSDNNGTHSHINCNMTKRACTGLVNM